MFTHKLYLKWPKFLWNFTAWAGAETTKVGESSAVISRSLNKDMFFNDARQPKLEFFIFG